MLESLEASWLWCCLLKGHQISGALFLDAGELSGLDEVRRIALVEQRIAATPLGSLADLKAGPVAPAMLQAVDDPFVHPLVLRIGDAALARDPISSHGLTHAFRSGVQGAAVAATVLDPSGETDAAFGFARDRHYEAVAAANLDTAVAHDAVRTASTAQLEVRRRPMLSQPLALGPSRREAVLDGNRVHWSEAIWLPNSNRAAAWIGPISAAKLAQILAEPAPIATLSHRLEHFVGAATAHAILQQLLAGGALRPAEKHNHTGWAKSA